MVAPIEPPLKKAQAATSPQANPDESNTAKVGFCSKWLIMRNIDHRTVLSGLRQTQGLAKVCKCIVSCIMYD